MQTTYRNRFDELLMVQLRTYYSICTVFVHIIVCTTKCTDNPINRDISIVHTSALQTFMMSIFIMNKKNRNKKLLCSA